MENLSEKHVLPTKLLIKVAEEAEKQTQSGIIIPGTANKISSLGSVVIAGSGVKEIEKGMSVMFSPHAAIKVKHADKEYSLLNYTDILLYW